MSPLTRRQQAALLLVIVLSLSAGAYAAWVNLGKDYFLPRNFA